MIYYNRTKARANTTSTAGQPAERNEEMSTTYCKRNPIGAALRAGSYDTKTHRYIRRECHDDKAQWIEIRRISKRMLDTPAALEDSNWTIVYTMLK